ncbi:MAG: hypothetical protein J5733_10020, partial [Bacteroidaceae bacterium]|nr:hypothetical protein [Bacteroidaceae bacterium]
TDDGCHKMRYVADMEDVHEAEIATYIYNVWYGSLVPLAKLGAAPAMDAAVDEDAKCGKAEREEIYECQQPQLECHGKEAQVGKENEDERPDGRVIRRPEDRREET